MPPLTRAALGVVALIALVVSPPAALAKKSKAVLARIAPPADHIQTQQRIVPRERQRPIDDARLSAVVQENKATMLLCYQRILHRDPTLTIAKMNTRLKIESSGQVAEVSFVDSPLGDGEIGQCLAQTMKKWTFPAAKTDYDFEFPLMLSAE